MSALETPNTIPFYKRLSWKSAQIAVGCAVCLGLIFSSLQIYSDIRHEQDRIAQFGQQSMSADIAQASRAAYRLDASVAQDIVDGLTSLHGVKAASIVDNFGDELAGMRDVFDAASLPLANRLLGTDLVPMATTLFGPDNKIVGILSIDLMPAAASPGFSDRTYNLFFSGFAKGFFLSLVLMFAYHRLISKRILDGAKKLEPGSEGALITDGSGDEIDLLLRQAIAWQKDLHKLQDEKAMENQRFHLATQAAGIGYWDWNMKTGQLNWDETMFAIYGVDSDQFGGLYQDWERYIHPEDKHETVRCLGMAISNCNDMNGQFRIIRHNDKAVRHITVYGIVMRDDAGTPIQVIGINRDITDRITLEQAFARSQRMEAIGKLTGGIAHDFNNALQAIMGHVDFLNQAKDDDKRFGRHMAAINRSTMRAGNLTKRLLAYARNQVLKPEVINPSDLIDNLDILIHQAVGANIQYRRFTPKDAGSISVDPSQLEDALINLVINARDAMPDGGLLSITVTHISRDHASALAFDTQPYHSMDGSLIEICVQDTGIGVAPEDLDRIIEPFYTTKSFGDSSGLGLSMVHGFIKQSGGELIIESELDQGTTVRLLFPKSADIAGTLHPLQHDSTSPVTGLNIVVVEDDVEVAEVIFGMLKDLGHDYIHFDRAQPALTYLQKHWDVDLVITDLSLPGNLSGAHLGQRINKTYSQIPVLYMTGNPSDLTEMMEITGEQDNLLQKPFAKVDLSQAIDQALYVGHNPNRNFVMSD